ncbi:MAG TPA: thioredoxin domain-containing protein [Bryobacteraceae bacterium]|nr:thioredoxin domain-containing protein [Bryobacteraceae bacterium]
MPFEFLSFCARCGAKSHIPAAYLTQRARCNACKSELAPVAEPIAVKDGELEDIVDRSQVPVLVEFCASWSHACEATAPEVRKLARDVQGRALVLKVDTDANPMLASRYGVDSIPNILIFQEGQQVFSRPGFARREEMLTWIEDFIGASRMSVGRI